VGSLSIRKEYLNNIVFSSDYPHSEGTFPFTQKVLSEGFARLPGLTESEKAAVLGLNAAKLFHIAVDRVPEETVRAKAA
jgi:predicted TIM-barrel fold metal-dependent hydrolase